jgi:hypothetical protein
VYDDLESRKKLTFAQAEGLAAPPRQLHRQEMPLVLRSRLAEVFRAWLHEDSPHSNFASGASKAVLLDLWINHLGRMGSQFPARISDIWNNIETYFVSGTYSDIFGIVQFCIRHRKMHPAKVARIEKILEEERAAFRIVDRDTLVPVGSEHELATIADALGATSTVRLAGAHAHLRNAAQRLTSGAFADSVRESIHAVEATARLIEPTDKLSDALTRLETSAGLHGAMKRGFTSLYGYASDEQGVRHPLLEAGDANVDEADALFMLGACAAFVTYLIAKGRRAGLIQSP